MDRIMLIDDEPAVLHALLRLIRREWRDAPPVEAFDRPRAALARLGETPFSAIMSDYRMPELDGVALLAQARQLQPLATRLILSGIDDFDVLMLAVNEAAITRFISKPWDDTEVVGALRAGVETFRRASEQASLAAQYKMESGELSPSALEMARLEKLEPGLLRVNWGPNGEVLFDDM